MKHLFTFSKSMKGICLSTFLFISAASSNGQTPLQAGDLIFVGYNAELNIDPGNDQFAFVLLKDISAGTDIYFTDFGWTSSGGFQKTPAVCGASMGAATDGVVKWTSTSAMAMGTQVVVNCRINVSANAGTAVGFQAMYNTPANNYMSLATGGDQIFAFQGTLASPTLIAGIGMSGAWESSLNCEFTSTASIIPPALGTAYCWNLLPEVDNAAYNPSFGTVGTPAALRALIMDASHWTTDDNANVPLPVAGTFNAPLYVNMSSFDIRKENATAGLYWTTQKETDNIGFDIQRSMDGKNYQAIGSVASKAINGNSRSVLSYSYCDKAPFKGVNFYRLAEKDKNGAVVYSDVRSLNFENASDFHCYPNPAKSQLTIEYNAPQDASMNICITDVTGKVVLSQPMHVQKGFNNTVVDISGLAQGMYNLIIGNGSYLVYISKIAKE